jgi:ABC-type branched-subunit amino acid transport system ATPase component
MSLRVASWAYVLDVGRIVVDGAARDLEASREVQDVFLGGRR